jgi:hypothetical protein
VTFWRIRWWPWHRERGETADAEATRELSARLAQAKRDRPAVDRMAAALADMPADQFAARVRAAMTLR